MVIDYKPQEIEKTIQKKWQEEDRYVSKPDDREKFLLPFNVSLSLREITYGSCKELHDW